jgi:hypothetical protein
VYIEEGGDTNRLERTNALLEKVLGVKLNAADVSDRPVGDPYDYAITITQAAVEAVIKQDGVVDNVDLLMSEAKARADKFITNPVHKWMFAKPEVISTSTTDVAVATGIELKVAVKADGSIKKGGKELLAVELYKQYTATLNGAPHDNQSFIKILIKELGMTKSGATTYAYNMKKRFGGPIKPKGTKAA